MKKRITAAELMAKLNADREFVARRAREEGERQKRVDELRLALSPLLDELRSAACNVTSVSDLTADPYPTAAPHPKALPILLAHLQRPYPADARELMARALAVPEARSGWDVLTRLYRDERETRAKDGLAVAIAAATDDEHIDDVIALVQDTRHGSSRLLLLMALERSRDPRARAALLGLDADPELAKEAKRVLHRPSVKTARSRATGEFSEVSMNFDSHLVGPFLERVSGIVSGLGTSEIAKVTRLLDALEVEGEGELHFEVEHGGDAVPLRIEVFMDDTDAPDLYFFTVPKLASDIDGLLKNFCEEHGI